VTATFNESVLASSITTASFVLQDPNNNIVAASVTYSDSNHTATLTPIAPLTASTTYRATIIGAKNNSGAEMAPVSWTFNTAPATTIPLVTVSSVQPTLSRHLVTGVLIRFSGAIDAGEAQLLRFYGLTIAGNHASFTARNARSVRIRSAVYDSGQNSVTLTTRKPFSLAKPLQLIIFGKPLSGLQDDLGRFIDGGTNVVAIIRRGGVTITQ
jgi:hypothetical protein